MNKNLLNDFNTIGKCVVCGREVTEDESYSCRHENIHCIWCVRELAHKNNMTEYDYVSKYIHSRGQLIDQLLIELENTKHPIKHHKPSSGYNYLYNETPIEYPRKKFNLFCKHKNTVDIRVGDADPGFMHTTYIHTVCKDCGKLIEVDNKPYKGRIKYPNSR